MNKSVYVHNIEYIDLVDIEEILLYAKCIILRFEQLKHKARLAVITGNHNKLHSHWLMKSSCDSSLSVAYSSVSCGGRAGSCANLLPLMLSTCNLQPMRWC